MNSVIRQDSGTSSVHDPGGACTPWTAAARRDFWGLSVAIALAALALGMVMPMTALRLAAAGHSSELIGVLLAVHALGLMLAMPLTAQLVDRWGARQALTWAGLGAAFVCAAMQGAGAVPTVAVCLLLLGVLLGLAFNLVETWVNALVPAATRGRWLAVHCTLFTLFQLGGPLLLQFVPEGHAYQLSGLLMLATVPVCQGLSQQALDGDSDADAHLAWWQLVLAAPALVWGTVVFALFDALALGLLPVYARLAGLSQADALLSASVVLAGDTTLEWVVGALADRHGRLRVQLLCALSLSIGALLLPVTIGHAAWWVLLFVIGGAAGGIYVLSLMSSGQRFAGRALLRMTALLGASWGAASLAGPLLTGVLMQFDRTWALPGVIAASAMLLLLALVWEELREPFAPVGPP